MIKLVAIESESRREVRLPTAEELPSWLAAQRSKAGLSLQDLAKALSKKAGFSLSRQSLHNWERGDASPSPDHLILLVDYFGYQLGDAVGQTVDTPASQ
jgi:transcriptional regulator with XRE-family HTH domain